MFIRFTVGRSDASAVHLRYISRPPALEQGRGTVRLVNLPGHVADALSYSELRANLLAYAATRASIEQRSGRGSRTFYRALMSFEKRVSAGTALELAQEWLRTVLPKARAAIFFHTDTAHRHLHLWIEARQTDGRKITLSATAYRRLDEAWNRLYAHAFGRDEAAHLRKKGETAAFRSNRREGPLTKRPKRAARRLVRQEYREREAKGAGEDGINLRRPDGDQPEASGCAADREPGKRGAAHGKRATGAGKRALERSARARHQAASVRDGATGADADAVSELQRLCAAAAQVAARAREIEESLERE